ncbi:MAG: histidine kinase dimerization/phosphoacceptor domain -containing protein [Bacteroidota bacterium]
MILYPVGLVIAQDKPTHSMDELNLLLKESKLDTGRINLLLEAALTYILRPGTMKNDIDSAIYFISSANNLALTLNDPPSEARCWYMFSQLHRETGEKEKGKKYAEKAITIFTKYDLKSKLADAYIELSQYYDIYADSDYSNKILYYQTAEDLYRQSGEKQKQAYTLKNLADFHQLYEKDSVALTELQQALAIYKSINYPGVQGVYDLLGYVSYTLGNYKQALSYGLLAVQTAQKVKVSDAELSTIYNRVGTTYHQLRQYEEAIDYFKSSFALAMKNQDTTNARVISPNIINTYMRLNKKQEAISFLKSVENIYTTAPDWDKANFITTLVGLYLQVGQLEKTEPYIPQLLRMVPNETEPGAVKNINMTLISYYYNAGKYYEMYKYLPTYEKLAKEYGTISNLADSYYLWFKADSSLGNYPQAIAHYKLYKTASDSALNVVNNKQVAQLLIEFQTEKKNKDIELLTKQGEFQRSQLKQTSFTRNVMIGGAIMLALLLGISYNRYRLKQRSNIKLQLQQEEINEKNDSLQHLLDQKEKLLEEKEWLVKEIHHRVKNNLQIVVSLLNTQAAHLQEGDALMAIQESRHRMQIISLLHQKLYQVETSSLIDMQVYIREVISYLKESFRGINHLYFEQQIDFIILEISQAVPVGLILNEAITNCIKYAFPNNVNGNITVSFTKVEEEHLLLTIADNGVGIEKAVDPSQRNSLGMQLMQTLSEQLDGNIKIENMEGTVVKVCFRQQGTVKISA